LTIQLIFGYILPWDGMGTIEGNPRFGAGIDSQFRV